MTIEQAIELKRISGDRSSWALLMLQTPGACFLRQPVEVRQVRTRVVTTTHGCGMVAAKLSHASAISKLAPSHPDMYTSRPLAVGRCGLLGIHSSINVGFCGIIAGIGVGSSLCNRRCKCQGTKCVCSAELILVKCIAGLTGHRNMIVGQHAEPFSSIST